VSIPAGKFIIGLTGNIGTGKSVVRRMLEHLGAYGIDADALSRRAISKGAPGYKPVVELFGRWILDEQEDIDRKKLGTVVFNHPDALIQLEKIVHPLVKQATDYYIRTATQKVVVVEAIKLIETGMHTDYNCLWVTTTTPENQLARLMKDRKMSETDARQRMAAQSPQEQKIALADVVINNNGSFTETWQAVSSAWEKLFQKGDTQPINPIGQKSTSKGEIKILRGKPRNSAEIAAMINMLEKPALPLTADDIMAAFGEKAFFLLQINYQLAGVVGWQVENLVTRVSEVYLDPQVVAANVLPTLINEIEQASADLQSEASLVAFPDKFGKNDAMWQKLGYLVCSQTSLDVSAWQEAAQELTKPGKTLYFKQLRQDRVLKPI
jgi:dephospho-CoA kinase